MGKSSEINYEPIYSLSINDRQLDFFAVNHIDPDTGQAGFLYYNDHWLNGNVDVIHHYVGLVLFKCVNENGVLQESPVNQCLLGATGEITDMSEKTILIIHDQLLVAFADSVFCFNPSDLKLKWKQKVDLVTCLGLYPVGSNFLIHGAFEISMMNIGGNRLWCLSSKGVSWDFYKGIHSLELEQDNFKIWDWDKREFCFNYEGKFVDGPEAINSRHMNVELNRDLNRRIDLKSDNRGKHQIALLFVFAALVVILTMVIKTYF